MAITASDLILYGSTGRPTDDATVTGGSIDVTARPITSPMSSAEVIEVLSSSSSDGRTLTIVYRTTDGTLGTWTPTIAGTSAVAISTGTPNYIESIDLSSASTDWAVIVRMSSGQVIHTLNPGEVTGFRMFRNAISTGSQEIRYEKLFLKNVSTDADLSNAFLSITSDASTQFRIGLSDAVNNTSQWANRLTDPSVTLVDTSSGIAVPGSTLGSTDAIGVIVEQTLAANASAAHPSFQIDARGGTIVSS